MSKKKRNAVYVDKITEDAPTECADSRFLKVDQSVIIGYAKNVSMARSIEECIEQCLTEHFQCRVCHSEIGYPEKY